MIAISKETIINKYNPTKEIYVGKRKIVQDNYFCDIFNELGVISKCNSINGYFYIVINKKDEIFLIYENQIIVQNINVQLPISSKTIEYKFSDFLPLSELDI